ncbi:hypothetical protein WDW86_17380 [Bdellovibrionota bacterium FG-2]
MRLKEGSSPVWCSAVSLGSDSYVGAAVHYIASICPAVSYVEIRLKKKLGEKRDFKIGRDPKAGKLFTSEIRTSQGSPVGTLVIRGRFPEFFLPQNQAAVEKAVLELGELWRE